MPHFATIGLSAKKKESFNALRKKYKYEPKMNAFP